MDDIYIENPYKKGKKWSEIVFLFVFWAIIVSIVLFLMGYTVPSPPNDEQEFELLNPRF